MLLLSPPHLLNSRFFCKTFVDAETEIPLDSPGHERKAAASGSSNKPETGSAFSERTSSVKPSAPDNVASGFTAFARQNEAHKTQVAVFLSDTFTVCILFSN